MKTLDNIKIKTDKLKFYYLFTILTSLFISYYFENNTLIVVSIFLSLFFSFLNPIIIGIPLLIMSTFDDRIIFLVTEGITLSRAIIICLIISILFKYIIVKQKLHIKPNKDAIIFIFFLFFINMFSMLNSLSQSDSIISFFAISLNIIFFFIFVSLSDIEDDLLYNQIILVIIYTIFFFFIWIFTKDISNFELKTFIYGRERLDLISRAGSSEFSRSLALGISFLFYHIINNKTRNFIKRIVLYSALILGFFMLIGSGTRMAFYGVIFSMLFIYILFLKRNKRKELNDYLKTSILLCIISGILIFYFKYSPFFSRYSLQSIIQSGGTLRSEIWEFNIKNILPKYYLYGTGLGGITEKIALIKEGSAVFSVAAHNMFLQIFIELGLFGLLIYGMFFFTTFKKGFSATKKNFPFIIPYFTLFLICIFMGIGEGMFTIRIFWISIALVWRYSSKQFRKDIAI